MNIRTGHNPADWQDLGPARGRTQHQGGSFGGPIVVVGKPNSPAAMNRMIQGQLDRGLPVAKPNGRPWSGERCGRIMPSGLICGRMRHEPSTWCKSTVAMERQRDRNRRKRRP
jgi:hypothetical protein